MSKLVNGRILIVVTQEKIDEAVPRDSGHCMIAESIKASIPDIVHQTVAVDMQTIRFTRTSTQKRYVYLTPRTVQMALINFDGGVKPPPFEFQLRQPQIIPAGGNKGSTRKGPMPEEQKEKHRDSAQRHYEKKRLLRFKASGSIPEVRGGEPPPLQRFLQDNKKVPFSRRRAFGLRALDM